MKAFGLIFGAGLLLAGCTVTTTSQPQRSGGAVASVDRSQDSFETVVRRVEPVAERVCRSRGIVSNCDYRILVDNRAGVPANAFQTLDKNGRPVIVFTGALLKEMRNADEVAFVLGHEAAHHIEGHIAKTQESATTGAILAGLMVAASGGDAAAIEAAQEFGAFAGSRAYSKNFELEADAVGTIVTHFAGYDPVRGAQYFTRIPDPGDQFLGTHPPNSARMQIVRETAAQLN